MSLVINTNTMSLNAQRNLSTSQTQMATSLERLSSGLRINSAKDDAAGLAISQRMTTQINGLNQAVRNANDGISLAQTAEGALGEMNANLQRIRELAVQSANATNSNADRVALDQEVQQRLAEIDRIANQTSFNGRNVLDGTFGDALFQVGANVGQTISVNLDTSMRLDSVGAVAQADSVDTTGTFQNSATLGLGSFTASVAGAAGDDLTMTFDDGTNTLDITAAVAAGPTQITDATVAAAFVTAGFVADGTGEVSGYTLDLGGEATIEAAIGAGSLTVVREDGASFSYSEATSDGSTGAASFTTDPSFTAAPAASVDTPASPLTISDDFSIQIGDADAVAVANGEYTSAQGLVDAMNLALAGEGRASLNDDGTITLTSQSAITISGDVGLTDLGFDAETTASGDLTSANVLDVDAANDTIYRMDSALTSVSDLRSTFGAVQNRFESTIANLSSTVENLSSARSRVMDADFAAETAELTRTQILQQAGVSVLAQANMQPQMALSLLQ